MKRFQDKLEKFDEALRDSIIKKFEYTFDLSWKTIKAYLEELNTLYKFDVIDFNTLKNDKFKEEILKDGIVIFDN